VVYCGTVTATEKSHLAGVDELDAGWEDKNDATVDALDAGWGDASAKNASVDALDAGWGEDAEDAEDADEPRQTEPEEIAEPEPPGLTPEQRRARKEELAARVLARKERARAEALAKKERRRARAEAASANKKQKQKQKKAPRREHPSAPVVRTAEVRHGGSGVREEARVAPRRDRSTTIVVMVLLALAATGSVVFFLKK
jgi:FtsZ-interacting cell division protein ZipA